MPTISNVYCPGCAVFMKCEMAGVIIEEKRVGNLPYKLWSADLYRCPVCTREVVTNFGSRPTVEHFDGKYEIMKKEYKKNLGRFFMSEIYLKP